MTTITIGCGIVEGVAAIPVRVEATLRHASDGTPRLLGSVDSCVREAYHRVLQAFSSLGLPTPRGVVTVNFSPADLRKQGSGFDFSLALALAGAAGLFDPAGAIGLYAIGEVSLSGLVLPARGAVNVALAAHHAGARALLCSHADAESCRLVGGLAVHAATTLADAVHWLGGRKELPSQPTARTAAVRPQYDLVDLRGLTSQKRALAVAAAGGHNLLLAGPPGTGKSALLRRLPPLLPAPSPAQRLAILQVHAAAGLPFPEPSERPFRAPHHSSSTTSLLGGGTGDVRPGEASLAHCGVLFLDELPEFRRDALEALRQPLEDGVVAIGRARRMVLLPAQFLLAATMNGCPCGYAGHRRRPCVCTPSAIARYRARLSGPLLDRIDIHVMVPALEAAEMHAAATAQDTTAYWQQCVQQARERQQFRAQREPSWLDNSRLEGEALLKACATTPRTLHFAEELLDRHHESGRARVRLLRLARTLADLADRDSVADEDLLEAAQLRGARQFGVLV